MKLLSPDEVKNPLLTCEDCHFLIKGSDSRAPQAHICRRHPKSVTNALVPKPPAPRKPSPIDLPNGMQVDVVQMQAVQMQGNPTQEPEAPACGDFADDRGRGYWVVYHERRAAKVAKV
jgi:hypothetical protein